MRTVNGKRLWRSRAFSLIELLLVLVILSVLAGIVLPKVTGISKKSRITKAETEIANIGTALKRFEMDLDRFPTTDEGLQALVTPPSGVTEGKWQGPYLERGVPKDPWGKAYLYRSPGVNRADYDLYSLGADGGEGNDDITNWQPL